MEQLSCSLVSVLIVATAIVLTAGVIIITRRQRTILAQPALNLNRRIRRNQGPRLSLQNTPMVQSQPLPSDRPTQTQSHSVSPQEPAVQPTNPQEPAVQPTNPQEPAVQPTNSAMAPYQPLRSQSHQPRSAQTQSQPTNQQEPSVQPIPSNSASEREAMALLQPSRSRQHQPLPTQTQSQEHDSLSPGHQRQQTYIDSPYSEDRFWLGQTALSRIIRDLPQRTRASLVSQPVNLMDLALLFPVKLFKA
ncbi:hypothetical protein PoB_000627800 [Plakobranchus ocellatus]|uniref:Uncharacterized protein n=1 Tax=Plakobranchus ocellatus TaxID=259542 RepID=A0AAV3YBA3_9GAST|nr:hypothetical protein PoB_000627800 [Plakobranchus ocellatus]